MICGCTAVVVAVGFDCCSWGVDFRDVVPPCAVVFAAEADSMGDLGGPLGCAAVCDGCATVLVGANCAGEVVAVCLASAGGCTGFGT